MNHEAKIRPVVVPARALVQLDDDDSHDFMTGEDGLATALRLAWSAAYRNRLLIAAIVGAALMLGLVVTMLTTPRFMATASVQIDQEAVKVLGTEDSQPAATQDADRFLQTQIDVLKSRLVAEQVAASLGLAADNRFLVAMGTKPAPSLTPAQRREQVVHLLSDNLVVDLPRNSRIVDIGFKSPDPDLARRVADSFADNFVLLNLKRKFDQTAYARNFLQQQLAGAKQRLEDSERAMLDYSRAAGLIDASAGVGGGSEGASAGGGGGPRSLVTSDLVSLNAAYTNARATRLATQQRWEQAQATPLFSLPEVLANGAFNQLTQARAQVQASYDQERQRHRADFPSLQQLGAQLNSLDRQITQVATAIRNGIRDQYQTAAKQETALAGSVDALKRETLSEQERSVRYNILRRETDTNRTMYDGLLQRFRQLSAEAGVSTNNISVVDHAERPARPFSPRLGTNLAIALLLGLVIAAAAVFVREKFDDVIRSPDDVPAKLGVALLNTVPMLRSGETPTEELDNPRSMLFESYTALRTSLELADTAGLPEVLLFTSSRSGEGKSTSAYAVARNFARLGRRVVLIDGDLRRPSLHHLFTLSNKLGFSSVLARQTPLGDALQITNTAGLAFLASGPLPPNPAELLAGPMLRDTLDRLRTEFDVVIIDAPPVLGLADTITLAAQAQGIIYVIEANGAHRGQAKAAIRRLRTTGIPILGAVLTKFNPKKIGHGYEYGYYAYSYQQEDSHNAVANA